MPVDNDMVRVHTHGCTLSLSTNQLGIGVSVKMGNLANAIIIKEETSQDDLNNYATNFLNWYFVSLVLHDVIKEGNINMINVVLKFLAPLFFSHSKLSKYMAECIDFILKTEYLLSPRMSLKVKAGAFVNVSGRVGHNKAADMHKENEVKELKKAIKGLGANKCEKNIIQISKASPVVNGISSNLCNMLDVQLHKTNHKMRSDEEDVTKLVCHLHEKRPWLVMPGRRLHAFPRIRKSPYTFALEQFNLCSMNTATRLERGMPLYHDDSDSDDSDDSESDDI